MSSSEVHKPLAASQLRQVRKQQARRFAVRAFLVVGLPSIVVALYNGVLASRQYESLATVAVDAANSASLLGPTPGVLVPRDGIYAATARVDGEEIPAAVSIGVRPTFEDAGDVRVEAHLIGWDGDLYGRTLRLSFLERLRDEVKFDSAEDLQRQMRADVEQVERIAAR